MLRFDAGLQLPLRDILHALVDGERQRHARLRRGVHVRIEAAVLHVHHQALGTVAALAAPYRASAPRPPRPLRP